jgi:hypothetical protein
MLACGCRERTSRQIEVHGHQCSEKFKADTAQYYANNTRQMHTRRCVILGSGDISLIMAINGIQALKCFINGGRNITYRSIKNTYGSD